MEAAGAMQVRGRRSVAGFSGADAAQRRGETEKKSSRESKKNPKSAKGRQTEAIWKSRAGVEGCRREG